MSIHIHAVRKFSLLLLLPLLLVASLLFFLNAPPLAAQEDSVNLTLNLTGLEDLGPGWVYEGWLIDNGSPVSSGRFTVDGSGIPSMTEFQAFVSDVNNVAAFVLTIEPDPDPDPAPSDSHLLGGDFNNQSATLTVGHPAALGNDFSTASGAFILAVPSDDTGMASYRNGIWWLNPVTIPAPSLDLPTLPAGWVYEGWVVGSNGPMSTGWFTDTAMADSDGAGPYGGSNPTPPFPGQDFITPTIDLTTGYAAVISIEPYPDNSPDPFTLKPLLDNDIEDVGMGVLQDMSNIAVQTFPTGDATLNTTRLYIPILYRPN